MWTVTATAKVKCLVHTPDRTFTIRHHFLDDKKVGRDIILQSRQPWPITLTLPPLLYNFQQGVPRQVGAKWAAFRPNWLRQKWLNSLVPHARSHRPCQGGLGGQQWPGLASYKLSFLLRPTSPRRSTPSAVLPAPGHPSV